MGGCNRTSGRATTSVRRPEPVHDLHAGRRRLLRQFTQADTDGDGYCDIVENSSCNPNDAGDPVPADVFSGRPGKGLQGLLTMPRLRPFWDVPNDPAQQDGGTCGRTVSRGKIAVPGTAPTVIRRQHCRVVVNFQNTTITLLAKLQKTLLTAAFSPQQLSRRGCLDRPTRLQQAR
jgi:hypothetical protein